MLNNLKQMQGSPRRHEKIIEESKEYTQPFSEHKQ